MTDEQLNIACAEIVMGWKRMSYAEAYPNANYPDPERMTMYWHSSNGKEQALAEDSHDYYNPKEAWSPSTNIAEAWKVQSYLHEHLGLLSEFIHELGKLMPPKHNLATVGPRERCIAALKAKGVEV